MTFGRAPISNVADSLDGAYLGLFTLLQNILRDKGWRTTTCCRVRSVAPRKRILTSVPGHLVQLFYSFISLHIRSMWETICDAQAGFWLNSKFLSKFSRKPLSGISDQKAPQWKTSDLRWPKFTPEYPPNQKLQIWDHQSLLWNTPPKWKLQIWDDQSLLWNTPPKWKTSDLRWPNFTLEYPPPEGLQSGRSYVETNLHPPSTPLIVYLSMIPTKFVVASF